MNTTGLGRIDPRSSTQYSSSSVVRYSFQVWKEWSSTAHPAQEVKASGSWLVRIAMSTTSFSFVKQSKDFRTSSSNLANHGAGSFLNGGGGLKVFDGFRSTGEGGVACFRGGLGVVWGDAAGAVVPVSSVVGIIPGNRRRVGGADSGDPATSEKIFRSCVQDSTLGGKPRSLVAAKTAVSSVGYLSGLEIISASKF